MTPTQGRFWLVQSTPNLCFFAAPLDEPRQCVDFIIYRIYPLQSSNTQYPGNRRIKLWSTSIVTFYRGATQEFELRSIKFKKYILGLRSIFWFPKEAYFCVKTSLTSKIVRKITNSCKVGPTYFFSKSGVTWPKICPT